MRKHNFKKLKIWQKGMDLVDMVYEYLEGLPSSERYILVDQMKRCVIAIPSNIAEGAGKRTNKDFANYLSIALGSSFELETQGIICKRRKYGNLELLDKILSELEEEQKMIAKFQHSVESGSLSSN